MPINDFSDAPKIPEEAIELMQTAKECFDSLIHSEEYEIIKTTIGVIASYISDIAETVKTAVAVVQPYFEPLREIARQFTEAIAQCEFPTISEEEKARLIESNKQWGRYGWTFIPSMPIDLFNEAPPDLKTANRLAVHYCSDAEMEKLFDTLRGTRMNHKDLESAIFCYRNRQYKACSLVLCGLIDSKMIRMRKDPKRPVGANAVKSLSARFASDTERMFLMLLFGSNLITYLETLFERGDGFLNEPDTFSRNFVGHGMNQRAVRKRDCIQLFIALNNLMQFFTFGL